MTLFSLLLTTSLVASGPRQETTPLAAELDRSRTLIVGTKVAAPFSFQGPDGEWRGISIDLWRTIARELDLEFEFRERSLEQLVSGLQDKSLDCVAAALTVTASRERSLDFSHPFHPSGLGIAVTPPEDEGVWGLVKSVVSLRFVQAIATLLVLIFGAGALLWLLERRRNPEQFGGSALQGLGEAFWWSAVTMTTVGYGDRAPATKLGRAFAVVWMFVSVITISGLTAAIASTLTVSRLEFDIRGPDDLPNVDRIVCVRGSTAEDYLRERRIPSISVITPTEGMDGVANGSFDALVYDAPILRYLASREFPETVSVLPVTFERQDYALGLPVGSSLRKPVNRILLEHVHSPEWDAVLTRYLGDS